MSATTDIKDVEALAVVVIGRNEGARLIACLQSLAGTNARVIYVDSGSSDASVAEARSAGIEVVELGPAKPYTAARARNAGVRFLRDIGAKPEFIQFFDGDCIVAEGWLETGLAALRGDPQLGLVTGWRSEIHPDASIYNDMCDIEWHRPAGEIVACGGDMMVRRKAFEEIGGFDPDVIAAEDDEFCLRLDIAGWALRRLPEDMTYHDAAMRRFPQWWRRARRSGHGFAQVGDLHPMYFRRERARAVIFGLILPVLALLGLGVAPLLTGIVLLAYAVSYGRGYRSMRAAKLDPAPALRHAGFLAISKFPNLMGMVQYYLRKWSRRAMRIIEYK